ncbi:MAG: hypothetical protein WKG32_07770 [Gemmatimonadaceae bacterium]
MPKLTIGRRVVAATSALALLALAAGRAGAQQTYPQTLYWGAGLVDIPVAWVAPLTGDFALNYSNKRFERGDPNVTKINYDDQQNSQLTLSMSFLGRLEAGVAFYSSNPEYGFFGQGLLLNEETLRERGGLARWIPSVAVGVRNVGPYQQIDRFGAGYDLIPPRAGSPNYRHVADGVHRGFDTQNTFYGVATKGLNFADLRSGWPNVDLSLTLGYGNGLFKDDNDLDNLYAKHSTGGLFGGVKVDFQPARLTTVSLMAENNAWDYNLGGSIDYRGIRAGLYFTEIGSGSARRDTAPNFLYNYSKFAFTVGWQSNIFALLRGDFLRGRVAELERRREGLLAEINARQQRIQSLELEINRYEAQNLLELEQRRQEAEAQLKAEREALQRLEERLKALEGRNPPPTPPVRPPLQ